MAQIATREEWLEARRELLAAEKELKRASDALAAKRRELPWVPVTTDYRFEGSDGDVGLAELFGDNSQLVVYHFMYGADWEKPCPSCSFWADHFDGVREHLENRDVRLVAVSKAPRSRLADWAVKARWYFPWYSSANSTFNEDYGVTLDGNGEYNYRKSGSTGEMPGMSVFIKDNDGQIFHTYSAYARGLEAMNATYGILDLVPKGRDEAALDWPMQWVKRLAETR